MQVYYGNYYGTMVYCNIRIAYGLLCGSTMVYYGTMKLSILTQHNCMAWFVCPISHLGPCRLSPAVRNRSHGGITGAILVTTCENFELDHSLEWIDLG